MEFEKGDRIVLTTDRHGTSEKNPVWGSIYECHGTIKRVSVNSRVGFPINVQWDNGSSNIYDHPDLAMLGLKQTEADNPNTTFKKMLDNGCYSRYEE